MVTNEKVKTIKRMAKITRKLIRDGVYATSTYLET